MEIVIKNKYGNRVCLIDEEDFLLLTNKIVYLRGQAKYIALKDKTTKKQEYLHRVIVNAKKGEEVDHINRDKYDNRKKNLRKCTRAQNCHNSRGRSNFKGVSWHEGDKKWRARIVHNGKTYSKNYFSSEIEAAKWYDQMAEFFYGEYAFLNFVK